MGFFSFPGIGFQETQLGTKRSPSLLTPTFSREPPTTGTALLHQPSCLPQSPPQLVPSQCRSDLQGTGRGALQVVGAEESAWLLGFLPSLSHLPCLPIPLHPQILEDLDQEERCLSTKQATSAPQTLVLPALGARKRVEWNSSLRLKLMMDRVLQSYGIHSKGH